MFFELPWVGVAKDAMAVAISIKYLVCQNRYITFYLGIYVILLLLVVIMEILYFSMIVMLHVLVYEIGLKRTGTLTLSPLPTTAMSHLR